MLFAGKGRPQAVGEEREQDLALSRAAGKLRSRGFPPCTARSVPRRMAAAAGIAATASHAAGGDSPPALASHVGRCRQNDKDNKKCFHTFSASCDVRLAYLKTNVNSNLTTSRKRLPSPARAARARHRRHRCHKGYAHGRAGGSRTCGPARAGSSRCADHRSR